MGHEIARARSHAPRFLCLAHQLQELSAVAIGIIADGAAGLLDHICEVE